MTFIVGVKSYMEVSSEIFYKTVIVDICTLRDRVISKCSVINKVHGHIRPMH